MKGNILLVDDNVEFADSIKDVLEGEGYRAVTVASGAAALSSLRQQQFDIVIMTSRCPA